jgi:hypothetical protein
MRRAAAEACAQGARAAECGTGRTARHQRRPARGPMLPPLGACQPLVGPRRRWSGASAAVARLRPPARGVGPGRPPPSRRATRVWAASPPFWGARPLRKGGPSTGVGLNRPGPGGARGGSAVRARPAMACGPAAGRRTGQCVGGPLAMRPRGRQVAHEVPARRARTKDGPHRSMRQVTRRRPWGARVAPAPASDAACFAFGYAAGCFATTGSLATTGCTRCRPSAIPMHPQHTILKRLVMEDAAYSRGPVVYGPLGKTATAESQAPNGMSPSARSRPPTDSSPAGRQLQGPRRLGYKSESMSNLSSGLGPQVCGPPLLQAAVPLRAQALLQPKMPSAQVRCGPWLRSGPSLDSDSGSRCESLCDGRSASGCHWAWPAHVLRSMPHSMQAEELSSYTG